jgi:hypothetical protein
MRRTIFTIVAAVSLLAFAIMLFAWFKVPGSRRGRGALFRTASYEFELRRLPGSSGGKHPYPGSFCFVVTGGVRTLQGFHALPGKMWNGRWANPDHRLPTNIWYGKSPSNDPTAAFYFGLVIPWWELLTLPALLPCLWIALRWLRPKARSAGRCRACDYDLTGNASGICPECGTPITLLAILGDRIRSLMSCNASLRRCVAD